MASLAVGLGSSLIGGIFGRPRSQTNSFNQTQSQTLDPLYNPKGRKVGKVLGRTLIDMIQNPTINQGLRIQNRNQINDVYDQNQNRLDTILAARGFGNGGKANLNTVGLNLQRAQSMGQLESQLYQDALNRQFQAMQLGEGYSRPIGFNTTTQSSGTSTTPGMPFGQALGGALGNIGGDISSYLAMRNLFGSSNPFAGAGATGYRG